MKTVLKGQSNLVLRHKFNKTRTMIILVPYNFNRHNDDNPLSENLNVWKYILSLGTEETHF